MKHLERTPASLPPPNPHVVMKCSRDGTATSPGFLLITLKLFG